MLIKMTTSLVGADYSYASGDTVNVGSNEAARLIGAGFAVPVAAPAAPKLPAKAPSGKRRKAIDPAAIPTETAIDPNA